MGSETGMVLKLQLYTWLINRLFSNEIVSTA